MTGTRDAASPEGVPQSVLGIELLDLAQLDVTSSSTQPRLTQPSEGPGAAWSVAGPQDRQDHAWVSREAAMADDGVVVTGELGLGLVSYNVAATDAARASRLVAAGLFLDRVVGYVRLSGRGCLADVDMVAS
jgi:hypothetical protein